MMTYIVSTRLDADTRRELARAQGDRHVGKALRELVNWALTQRHEFQPRRGGRHCKFNECLRTKEHTIHWSDKEVQELKAEAQDCGFKWSEYYGAAASR